MWELIQANRRKSLFLFVCMGIILLSLGYVIGAIYIFPDGGISGIIIAAGIWGIWSLIGYFKGDSIILGLSRAKEVNHDIHPQLFNVVEEMKIAANLPVMPRVYIIDEESPNAFATGRKAERSSIAVTAGLLSQLNRDELQGVIAHEMSHILNKDVQFITFAGIMLGTIVLIAEFFLRGFRFTGSSRRYRSDRSSKGGGGIFVLIALGFAIVAPLLAHLLYLSISRKREYLADASAVRLTRYPEGLASALERIASTPLALPSVNRVSAPMYIVNPLNKAGKAFIGLFSTHPPTEERVKILRTMSQGVNYANYENAFQKITGKGIMPKSGINDTDIISVRGVSEETQKESSAKEQRRELGDLMMAVNGYRFVTCLCGLKYKVPPNFKKPQIPCRRCQRIVNIPSH